jgi:membrane protein
VAGERGRGVRELSRRGRDWVDTRDPGSRTGVAIGAWRHYQAVDGPRQTALLSLYMLVAVLPALLVMESFLDPHPNALAGRIVHHYHLNAPTSSLLHSVLSDGRQHELGSALLAAAGALVFGLGLGRVLQIVHVRAWGLTLPKRQTDQVLFAAVLLTVYGLILLLLVQLEELSGEPEWVGLALAAGWFGLLVGFFVFGPWLLTHRRLAPRDVLPSAVLTALALVVLIVVSRFLMQFWVDLYAKDYGGLGVVLAIYFWLAIASGAIVWAASLSPALAERREARGSRRID